MAQQPQVYNQFFMNPYVYNPAYAGVEGHTALFLMYRQQWTNIQGAPQTSHASFHVPLQGGIALGATSFNVTQGLLSTSAGKVSVGYLLNVDRTHFVRLGFSIGGGINSVNITKFDSPDDPAFNNFLDQNSFLIGDFGVTYHFGHFNAGFAIPNLFTYDVVTQTEVAPIKVTPLDNVLFKMNYRGHISDNFAIEPHFIYRFSEVVPHQFEGALIAHLKHIVWVGAAYRQDDGIIGLTGAKVKEKIGIGFAYELGNSNISTELGPTFEINIGYHLGTKKEHAEHISSFIKSHRLSAEERAEEAELERQKQMEELQKDSIQQNENNNEIQANQEVQDWQLQEDQVALQRTNQFGEKEIGIRLEKPNPSGGTDVVLSWIPASEAENLTVMKDGHLGRVSANGHREAGIKYQKTNPDGSTEEIIRWDRVISKQQAQTIIDRTDLTETGRRQIEKADPKLTQDFRTHDELGASSDYAVVRRGNHILELPARSFVIAGAFEVFAYAQNYSDKLFKQGFHDVIVGYSSARGYYYVVVFESDNVDRARSKRDEMRKSSVLSKAWVLQVTE